MPDNIHLFHINAMAESLLRTDILYLDLQLMMYKLVLHQNPKNRSYYHLPRGKMYFYMYQIEDHFQDIHNS